MRQSNGITQLPLSDEKRFRALARSLSAARAKEALPELERLAEEGVAEASLYLGVIYEFGGDDIEPNYEVAKKNYELAISNADVVEGYLGLARMYFAGKGVSVDRQRARDLYEEVIRCVDNPFAKYMLGRIYFDGVGIERDIQRAEEYFRFAWKGGHVLSLTMLAKIAHEQRKYCTSVWLRVKAGFEAFKIAGENANDPRIREM